MARQVLDATFGAVIVIRARIEPDIPAIGIADGDRNSGS
jgi:hypothetical protein